MEKSLRAVVVDGILFIIFCIITAALFMGPGSPPPVTGAAKKIPDADAVYLLPPARAAPPFLKIS